jgi:hypothetical protein
MLNAAELEDHEIVPVVWVVPANERPIGSGHGGISFTVISSMYM